MAAAALNATITNASESYSDSDAGLYTVTLKTATTGTTATIKQNLTALVELTFTATGGTPGTVTKYVRIVSTTEDVTIDNANGYTIPGSIYIEGTTVTAAGTIYGATFTTT